MSDSRQTEPGMIELCKVWLLLVITVGTAIFLTIGLPVAILTAAIWIIIKAFF